LVGSSSVTNALSRRWRAQKSAYETMEISAVSH
jgi:hypothetical protein